ncbi:hypothetical protein [Roseofilum sp. Guam]|uniref:hypothetical protein n=1 Tax=Roseofilum sp. Guam TaxID=2821502 RepID=UPI001B113A0F|nr:hypothetical protein [Roseofilum sp. Guam]MBP0030534.1 hypothetical protein [Roseofilum sp. Guam]
MKIPNNGGVIAPYPRVAELLRSLPATTTENPDRYSTVAVSPVAAVDRILHFQLAPAGVPFPVVGDRVLF